MRRMAAVDSRNCEIDEEVGGGVPISNLEDNNQKPQVESVSPKNSDLKRKLSSDEFENNLEIKENVMDEYDDTNSKRNKSNDSEHNKKNKTENCEIGEEEQQKETSAEVKGIVTECPNKATENNSAAPTSFKSVVTVKVEVVDTSDTNGETNEEFPAAASINDEASNKGGAAAVLPDIKPEVKVELGASDASINDEASNKDGAAAVPPDIKPEVKVELGVSDAYINDEAGNKDGAPAVPPDIKPEVKVELDASDASKNDEASNKDGAAAVPPDIKPEIKVELGASDASINDEASNGAAALPPGIQPEIKVVVNVLNDIDEIARPSCRFGVKCYRANALHRQEEAHPGDYDYRRPVYPQPPPDAPPCPFSSACYRRNPRHFQEFSHPEGYDAQVAMPPAPPPGQRFQFLANLDRFDVLELLDGFNSDSDSEFEPSDHEDSSDEGVSSGVDE